MKTRLITGIILAGGFIPLIIIEPLFIVFQIIMIGLVIIATYEMIKLFESKEKFSLASKIVIYISTLLLYFSLLGNFSIVGDITYDTDEPLLYLTIGFIPVVMLILIAVLSLLVFNDEFDGGSIGRTLTVILYIGASFAAVTLLRFLGVRFVIYLFMITIFTDVFAYVFGVKFGKHNMAPKISPKKSWEGAIGGSTVATISATIFAVFFGVIFNNARISDISTTNIFYTVIPFENLNSNFFTILIIFFMSLLISISGQIGDLIASKFKRTYEIKDFGKIFPGHGGVLDRLDSAIFASLLLATSIMVLSQFLV